MTHRVWSLVAVLVLILLALSFQETKKSLPLPPDPGSKPVVISDGSPLKLYSAAGWQNAGTNSVSPLPAGGELKDEGEGHAEAATGNPPSDQVFYADPNNGLKIEITYSAHTITAKTGTDRKNLTISTDHANCRFQADGDSRTLFYYCNGAKVQGHITDVKPRFCQNSQGQPCTDIQSSPPNTQVGFNHK